MGANNNKHSFPFSSLCSMLLSSCCKKQKYIINISFQYKMPEEASVSCKADVSVSPSLAFHQNTDA